MDKNVKKIVLAYSGGLDTSVILPWLKEKYPAARSSPSPPTWARAMRAGRHREEGPASGADKCIVNDLRQEFAEQYCFPMLKAGAVYEQHLPAGHLHRPAADRQGTRCESPTQGRRRRRRPRRHRQGQRPGAVRADLHGPGARAEDHRPVEGPASS